MLNNLKINDFLQKGTQGIIWRAGPHPIGQKSQLVKGSLGHESQDPDPQSQILNPRSPVPNHYKQTKNEKNVGKQNLTQFFFDQKSFDHNFIFLIFKLPLLQSSIFSVFGIWNLGPGIQDLGLRIWGPRLL